MHPRVESILQGKACKQLLYRSVVLPPCPTGRAAILQSVLAGWGRVEVGYRTVVLSPSRRSSGGRGEEMRREGGRGGRRRDALLQQHFRAETTALPARRAHTCTL